MKFSTIASLCLAPLALAYLDVELVEKDSVTIIQTQTSVTETQVIVIWINTGGAATTSTVNSVAAPAPSGAAAATHTVVVGGTAGLVYTPNSLVAAVGDMVIFEFMSANHTLTESAFAAPCVASAGGIDSGFMPNANNSVVPAPAMALQVTVATPLWFYCKQLGHCGKGMVFSINPTANKTQADFAALAIAQNGTAVAAPAASAASVAPPAASSGLATAIIVGGAGSGTSSTVSAAAVAAPTASIVAGTGTVSACSCLCGVAAFPLAAQGLAAFGGLSGAMPAAALMV